MALLSLHGRKVVGDLIAAASSSDARRRAASVTALGRIGDARARRSLTLALADRNTAVRAAAATALCAFPSEETVSRLRGMLERETEVEVRLRGAATLVDMFNNGMVEALDPLLSLVQDHEEDRHVRLEALKVLASLPPSEARSIASGLLKDQDQRLAQAAERFAGPASAGTSQGADEALSELDSSDYFTYRRAATLLASMGEAVLPTLVKALRARAGDAAACARVGSVLREVARGRERAVARHLDEVEELVPLGLMVDILGESRDRTALYHLKGVIDRLESGDPLTRSTHDREELARQTIIAKAHFHLARAGSRVAFDSLKATLAGAAQSGRRVMGEILMAVQEVGGREELLDLLALYRREEGWMKEKIAESFRRLMKKSRVNAEDPIFAKLDEGRHAILQEILGVLEVRAAAAPRDAKAKSPTPAGAPGRKS
ncbi:MAG TPA: HEAT repeat domain-containing protein [Candidatus Polarisedimenticolia bacterium]|nr:HEAT repeat domain-containing protein [Candidatus Polarisedimenticolia bacterium]